MWDLFREQMRKMGMQEALEDELRRGVALEARAAEARQRKLAKFNQNNPRRGVDGLGQTTMSMDPFYRALADISYGREWAKDPKARALLLQQHPEFAVQYAPRSMVTVIKP